jgi:hypothetical protein
MIEHYVPLMINMHEADRESSDQHSRASFSAPLFWSMVNRDQGQMIAACVCSEPFPRLEFWCRKVI